MLKQIPYIDYNVIIAKIQSILEGIAYDNKDFICSRCLRTKDQIIDLAEYILTETAAQRGYNLKECLDKHYEDMLAKLQSNDD